MLPNVLTATIGSKDLEIFVKRPIIGREISYKRITTNHITINVAEGAYALNTNELGHEDTYIARQTAFLDLNLIEFTFNKDGDYTVIPVVCDPIDAVGGITSPFLDDDKGKGNNDWWKIILIMLGIIILLIVLKPLLPTIIDFVVGAIKLPFKVVGGIFKGFGGNSKKSKESKPQEQQKLVIYHDFRQSNEVTKNNAKERLQNDNVKQQTQSTTKQNKDKDKGDSKKTAGSTAKTKAKTKGKSAAKNQS